MQSGSKYFKLEEGQVAYFDVDDTLILWEGCSEAVLYGADHDPMEMNFKGKRLYVRPLMTHVDQLIEQSCKGLKIVVWSAGGADWAEAVVQHLGLEAYVDVILTKPNFFYDDHKPEDFMRNHFYFANEERKKLKGIK